MKYEPYTNVDTPLFSSEQPFDVAFTCCLDSSHSDHLMRVVEDDDSRYAECLKEKLEVMLNDEHRMWFGEVRAHTKFDNHINFREQYICLLVSHTLFLLVL